MKKISFVLITLILFIAACGSDESENTENKGTSDETQKVEETEQSAPEEESKEKETEVEQGESEDGTSESEESEPEIDTSMYEYTKNIDLTDAIELNNHITLMIEMNPEPTPGLAFQHTLNGSYDFLQQDIVQQADTVGINVLQDGVKIAMFTANPKDFEANDEKPMANVVLNASEVEMMTDEVEQYADAMDLPIN